MPESTHVCKSHPIKCEKLANTECAHVSDVSIFDECNPFTSRCSLGPCMLMLSETISSHVRTASDKMRDIPDESISRPVRTTNAFCISLFAFEVPTHAIDHVFTQMCALRRRQSDRINHVTTIHRRRIISVPVASTRSCAWRIRHCPSACGQNALSSARGSDMLRYSSCHSYQNIYACIRL